MTSAIRRGNMDTDTHGKPGGEVKKDSTISTSYSWMSSLQNCEKINLYCFKLPGWWLTTQIHYMSAHEKAACAQVYYQHMLSFSKYCLVNALDFTRVQVFSHYEKLLKRTFFYYQNMPKKSRITCL